jgi:predicted ATPase
MDLGDITDSDIRRVLDGMRQGRSLPVTPLYKLEAARQSLLEAGLPDTPVNLDWALANVVAGIIKGRLAAERGVAATVPPESRQAFAQLIAADFESDNPDREAWSCLYHRYVVSNPFRVRQLAEFALPDYENGVRHINRRVKRGVRLLTLALREIEKQAIATAGLVPGPRFVSPASARRHNIPHRRSSFVGQEQALAEIGRRLADTAFVTLVGPGGVGKTRIALQVAEARAEDYADGAWLVELASLDDGALVGPAVADVLDVGATASQSSLDALIEKLQPQQLLLVLDNCEHLVSACADLAARLLAACPGLAILATSREPLGIEGEQVWRVPALDVPPASADPGRAADYASVRLFVDRVRAVRTGFELTATNAAEVAAVCRRLDGIPLAIELAAARARVLPIPVILRQLDDPLPALVGGWRNAEDRQKTLDGAIGWSYGLLTEAEKLLFTRLAVFRGGWSQEAAEAVGVGDLLDARHVAAILHSLVDKSLVVAELQGDAARYHFLETIRHFALDCLEAGAEFAALRRSHFSWCLDLAERAVPGLRGADQRDWLKCLEIESDNFRAAFDWAEASDDPDAVAFGLRLGAALWLFWYKRGYIQDDPADEETSHVSPYTIHARNYLSEGRARLGRLLDRAGPAVPQDVFADALHAKGTLATYQGDFASAENLLQRSLAIRQSIGDELGVSNALTNLANVVYLRGDFASAAVLYQQGIDLARERGDTWSVAIGLENLAGVASKQGDYAWARRLAEESLAASEAVGDQAGVASVLGQLGALAHNQGDFDAAHAYYEKGLQMHQSLGDARAVSQSLADLGILALDLGQHFTARTRFEASLRMSRDLGDVWAASRTLNCLGELYLYETENADAHACFDESVALATKVGNNHALGTALHYLCRVHCSVGEIPVARRRIIGVVQAIPLLLPSPCDMIRLGISVAALAVAEARWEAAFTLAAAIAVARSHDIPPLPLAEYDALDGYIATAREVLEVAAAEAAWERGSGMSLRAALDSAIPELRIGAG